MVAEEYQVVTPDLPLQKVVHPLFVRAARVFVAILLLQILSIAGRVIGGW